MFRLLLIGLLAALSGSSGAVADDATSSCPGRPDALGTSRVMTIGQESPTALGWKTYPQTLALADHEIVLTFDDGPSRSTTPRVLAALAAECVRATFFLIGRNAAAAPELVRREVAAGDTVGHHSYSHPAVTMRGLTDDKAQADIDKGFAADDRAGYGTASPEPRVPFFRFPGFADTPQLDAWLASRHITVFGADLWASDWIVMTPDQERDLLMTRLRAAGRGIILLHDIKAQTANMLPALLRTLKDEHFRIVHIVPGEGPTQTVMAPPGWHSQTEQTLAALHPRLGRERSAAGPATRSDAGP